MSMKHKRDLKELRDIPSSLIKVLESTEAKAQAGRVEKGKNVKIRGFRDQAFGLFSTRYATNRTKKKADAEELENFWSLM